MSTHGPAVDHLTRSHNAPLAADAVGDLDTMDPALLDQTRDLEIVRREGSGVRRGFDRVDREARVVGEEVVVEPTTGQAVRVEVGFPLRECTAENLWRRLSGLPEKS